MTTDLLKPILSGIKHTNFFEGRLLTGRDLREQQIADRDLRNRLGRIIGTGIVEGLEVMIEKDGSDGQPPVLKTLQGSAINAKGQVLELSKEYAMVRLSREFVIPDPPETYFKECLPPTTAVVPNNAGLYLFVMSPATVYEDYAPKSGLQTGGISADCGRRYIVDSVQFRLVEFNPIALPGIPNDIVDELKELLAGTTPAKTSEAKRLSRLRNIAAHLCFGSPSLLKTGPDPFTGNNTESEDQYFDAVDELRRLDLISTCDVPLALIYWTLDGIGFLDLWSVRRLINMDKSSTPWTSTALETSVFEAMLFQLQEHMNFLVKELIKDASLARNKAIDFFRYFPPIGLIPISGAGSARGFFLNDFFKDRDSGTPTIVSAEYVKQLVDEAKIYRPVDTERTDVLQLYWVNSNIQSVLSGASNQLYALFTSRALHGFRENDNVVKRLQQTWKSYSGLLRKHAILPKSINNEALPVWTAIHTDQQNIIQFAMNKESAASARKINRNNVIEVFNTLYSMQKNLTDDLRQTFSGDDGLPERTSFADELTKYLDNVDVGGNLGLMPAITADDYQAVLAAQQKINTLVSTWSGEFIWGDIQIEHIGSPDGDKLVPGSGQTYKFEVLFTARTDSRATFTVSASVIQSTSGSWGSAVSLQDPVTGSPVSLVTLTLNPDQDQLVNVLVTPPPDANINEDVVVEVVTEIPPPTNKKNSELINLTTSDQSGDPQFWSLELTPVVPPPGTTSVPISNPGGSFPFILESAFLASRPPTSIDNCILSATFEFTNSTRNDWGISIVGHPDSETGTDTGIFEYAFNLPGPFSGKKRTTISVTAPARRKDQAQSCTLSVAIAADIIDESDGSTVSIQDTLDPPFSITLAGTG